MDQIRTFMAWLKRHHFWVLSALAALVAVGCWYTAAGALSAKYEENENKINAEFTSQNGIEQKPFHANPDVNNQQRMVIKDQAARVESLWDTLYQRQQEHVLKWPAALPDKFHVHIAGKKFGDDIHRDMQQWYLDYAKGHFPELPKIVDALVLPDDQSNRYGGGYGDSVNYGQVERMMTEGRMGGRRTGRGKEEKPQDDFIVYWLDQNKVRQELNFPERPSPLKIWVTQENLWVYTTLLQAIANTNRAAGANRFSNAAIRVIGALDVGEPAAKQSRSKGRILVLQPQTPGGMGDEMGGFDAFGGEGGMGMERGMGEMGGFGGGMEGGYGMDEFGMGRGQAGADESAQLLSMRYLDEQGQPIITQGGETDPTAFGREYKQLPIRMDLQMDQRWLSHLIAECANAPLQVEVEEVRINPTDTGRGGYGGGGGEFGSRRGFGGSGMFGSNDPTQVLLFNPQPYLVRVIIQGTIYIFNEPDPELLEVDSTDV